MKEFDLGEGKVLVVREGTEFYALGTKCSHYGAPLVNGSHCNGRVRCPWHGACFSVKTGDIEDFPGLDSIPKFKVRYKSILYYILYLVLKYIHLKKPRRELPFCFEFMKTSSVHLTFSNWKLQPVIAYMFA